ncbi:MAG TPA: glycosyltransferase family 2 protein [Candidatus Korarchaeota archaeon]|nr:glycosyltransferase family 2 protein [Candidatus Korarchaeota archaeon]
MGFDLKNIILGYLNLLGISPKQALSILIIPIIFDLTRTITKAIVLPLHVLYRKIKPYSFQKTYHPSVSVIIPAHNEEETIEGCILSILEDPYPNKEVIVVDDGSTDRTYEIASKYAKEGKIRLLRRPPSGKKAYAVNYGLMFSKGEIVVVVDADTLVERGSLWELVKFLQLPNTGGVAGNVKVLNKKSLWCQLQAYEYITSMETGRRFYGLAGTVLIIPGAFGAANRRILEFTGRFDADTVTEDFDFTLKIHKTRMRVRFSSEAVAWTRVPDKIRDWIKQRVRWSKGQLETLLKHRDMLFNPFFGTPGVLGIPSMAFYDLVATSLKLIWLVYFSVFHPKLLFAAYALMIPFYFINELILGIVSWILTPKRGEFWVFFTLPLVVLFYRPLHGLVRLKGYIDGLFGREIRWKG